jgi:hypothetical protein
MITLPHTTVLHYLQNHTSSKEGAILAKQLLFFSSLWIFITGGIAYFGQGDISVEHPFSWLSLVLPIMGSYLFILAYQSHLYWQSLGKGSLHLAKATFHYHDKIRGYIEFNELTCNKHSQATVHISLKKKCDDGEYKEEWITNADTDVSASDKGIRVSFSTQVNPNLDKPPSPQQYTWCLYICLKHKDERFKQHFEIPISPDKTLEK